MTDEKIILLVEDNPDDVELILRAFRKAQVIAKLVNVRDGVEALEYLFGEGRYARRGLETDPSLVLLDLKLPRVDGLEVLQQMRSRPRTILVPVVIFTSSVEERDVVNAYRLGANSYVHKPIDMQQFVEMIKVLCLYWLTFNVAPAAAPVEPVSAANSEK